MDECKRTDLRQEYMKDTVELIHLQICLEYQLDANGDLVPFAGSSEQAFYIVYRHASGYLTFFNHLIPADLRNQLLALEPADAFEHPGRVNRLLRNNFQPCKGGKEIFWSGYFLDTPGREEFPDAIQDGDAWVVKVDGQAASKAISIRENSQCAEVYVETSFGFRQRGFGRQVTAAWAEQVRKNGRVAFYSFRKANISSAALAQSLGVRWYADVVSYEPG